MWANKSCDSRGRVAREDERRTERDEIRTERYEEREIERRDFGKSRRGRVRVSRGSHPRRDTGRGRSGGGGGGDGDGDGGGFTRVFTSPDTTTTYARDGGRDDTAPYWTALRKYNGAPLLRYVHPNLDVGVGATPLTPLAIYRMRPTLVGTGSSVASFSYPFIFRPPSPSAILRDGHPLTPPALSRQPSSPPSSFLHARSALPAFPPLFVLVFFSRRWSGPDPREALREGSLLQRDDNNNGELPVRIDNHFRSRSNGSPRRYSESSFPSAVPEQERQPPSLSRVPRGINIGGNRVRLELRSRAHGNDRSRYARAH